MNVDVVALPRDLRPEQLSGRAVVVFDVLRATTSMTAALAAGVREIRIFASLAEAKAAADGFAAESGGSAPARLLCGEEKCLPPPGFDLGNSPGAFDRARHAGRVVFLSTTNGTRAVLAARGAAAVFVGALVNASAVAAALESIGRDVTLLCAGTDGALSLEDLIGAGAVVEALSRRTPIVPESDTARAARRLFVGARDGLNGALADCAGGRNVIAAGLPQDVEFCARLDVTDVVGAVGAGAVVRPWQKTGTS